jgi:hypothetical protein
LTDISGEAASATLAFGVESGTYNTFGNSWSGVSVGPRSVQIDLTIVFTTTADEGYDLITDWYHGTAWNAARSIQIDAPDSTAGSFRYSGEVKLTGAPNVQLDAASGDAVVMTCQLSGHGTMTKADIT